MQRRSPSNYHRNHHEIQKNIDEPLLRYVCMKAICVELGRLAKRYGDTKGTNTINFMSLDKIPNIPVDQTVTYVRIAVDYRERKEDPIGYVLW